MCLALVGHVALVRYVVDSYNVYLYLYSQSKGSKTSCDGASLMETIL